MAEERNVVAVVVACTGAVAAFLTGGYAFGGVRRRKAIIDLIEIRKGLSRGADRTKIDALIKSELEALVQLGDTTSRWLRAGYMAGFVFICLSALCWLLADYLVVDAGAKVVTSYIAAGSCLAASLALGLTIQAHWEVRHDNRWSIVPTVVFTGVLIVGAGFATLLIEGTPYYTALFTGHS